MTDKECGYLIDVTNKHESICDEILEVLYIKHDRIPRRKDVINEIEMLRAEKDLKESDQKFLQLLITASVWFCKVPFSEYLQLWTYERHIPYKKAEV